MFCPGCGKSLPDHSAACTHCGLQLSAGAREAAAAEQRTALLGVETTFVGSLLEERYRVDYSLARGGMAEVFSGTDLRLQRRVAIKVLSPELRGLAEVRERFLREARAAARLEHPNIVPVYSSGEHAGAPYIVMKYVSGQTLADMVRTLGRVPPAQVISLMIQVCDGLEHIHRNGLVHRDIKPQNLMVDDNDRCLILDFGILREADSTMTATGIVAGTPAYMAPEQARDPKRADARSDLYALGVSLFEVLTGRLPYLGSSAVELMLKHQSEPPPRPSTVASGVPRSLDGVVLRLLAKDPGRRFPSAADVRAALEAARDAMAEGDGRGRVLGRIQPAAPRSPPAAAEPGKPQSVGAPAPPPPASRGGRSPLPRIVSLLVAALGAAVGWYLARDCVGGGERGSPAVVDLPSPRQAPSGGAGPPVRAPLPSSGSRGTRLFGPPVAAPEDSVVAASATEGRVEASSVPAGATLRADGRTLGTTPGSFVLAPGFHSLELSLPGYQVVRRGVYVERGKTERVRAVLEQLRATLEVVAKLDDGETGVEIAIDGEALGTSENVSSKLRPGTHEVRVRRSGYRTVFRRVTLAAGEKRRIEVELQRRSGRYRRYRRYRRSRRYRRRYRRRSRRE